jgi:hypothetical protein
MRVVLDARARLLVRLDSLLMLFGQVVVEAERIRHLPVAFLFIGECPDHRSQAAPLFGPLAIAIFVGKEDSRERCGRSELAKDGVDRVANRRVDYLVFILLRWRRDEAFTIASMEALEVSYEFVRRQIHEELLAVGSETVSEEAVETKQQDEVSDRVSTMIQRDSSVAMSASASGTVGVYSGEASASAELSMSSQNGRETAVRRVKEVTKRAAERITRSFSLKTRDVQEFTTTNRLRRVIKNEGASPVSYGLRRVLRRVSVKVQDLGPRLVWQLYLRNPGMGLARSRFVNFREAEPIAPPQVPPGCPPPPEDGTETGSTSAVLEQVMLGDASAPFDPLTWFVTLVINAGLDRDVKAVSIDSIGDLEGGGKDDEAPAPLNGQTAGWQQDPATGQFTVKIAVRRGDTSSVQLSYTYNWSPSQRVLDNWEQVRAAAVEQFSAEAENAQFERQKALITERSKIRSRPPADLRKEERYEIMNRMVSHLFGRGDDPSEPSPLEIESFNRFFDIGAIFTYNHPSWWKPRFSKSGTLDRPAYEITLESEPAPLGSSLGWLIQADGDARRNEFLNSPWVRVCVPIRPGREREGVAWLASHVEGDVGYDPESSPLKELLGAIGTRRDEESTLGMAGPEWVTVDATPGAPADPLTPQAIFPIIDQFDVTVPTDGFVYDSLSIITP